jgi:hypothetical protein
MLDTSGYSWNGLLPTIHVNQDTGEASRMILFVRAHSGKNRPRHPLDSEVRRPVVCPSLQDHTASDPVTRWTRVQFIEVGGDS